MDRLRLSMHTSLRIQGSASTNHHPQNRNSKSRSIKPFLNDHDLVGDLLMEIFIRLPLDSVCRCKSVSKSWLSLISSQSFTRQYELRTPICREALIFCQFDCSVSPPKSSYGVVDFGTETKSPSKTFKLSFSFLPEEVIERLNLLSSCNGLVLCKSYSTNRYYVCNPLTKQWVMIPPPPPSSSRYYGSRTCFVCLNDRDPRFKLVLVQERTMVACFCSDSGAWSQYFVSLLPLIDMVACNGKLYGLSLTNIHVYDPFNKPNEVGTIDWPCYSPYEMYFDHSEHIEGNQGKIRFYKFTEIACGTRNNKCLQVWELDDDDENSKWCFIKKICFNATISNILQEEELIRLRIMSFKEHNEDIVYFWMSKSVVRLNMKTVMVKVILHNITWGSVHPFLYPCQTPVPQYLHSW